MIEIGIKFGSMSHSPRFSVSKHKIIFICICKTLKWFTPFTTRNCKIAVRKPICGKIVISAAKRYQYAVAMFEFHFDLN